MRVPTLEARNRLSALLAEVAKGTEVIITKRGTPVARLTAIEPVFDREKARRAAAGLRKVSRGATLGGLNIKDMVNEDRS
jgi:prevent-host-death family protein